MLAVKQSKSAGGRLQQLPKYLNMSLGTESVATARAASVAMTGGLSCTGEIGLPYMPLWYVPCGDIGCLRCFEAMRRKPLLSLSMGNVVRYWAANCMVQSCNGWCNRWTSSSSKVRMFSLRHIAKGQLKLCTHAAALGSVMETGSSLVSAWRNAETQFKACVTVLWATRVRSWCEETSLDKHVGGAKKQ